MFTTLPLSLKLLLLPALSILNVFRGPLIDQAVPTSSLAFELRHQHATTNGSTIIFANAPSSFISDKFVINTQQSTSFKRILSTLSSVSGLRLRSEQAFWQEVRSPGPDVKSREALLLLAKMTYDAYYAPAHKEWYSLGAGWNNTFPFGWEPDADGFRGHIFVADDNSTVVISIKGTSAGWLVGGGGPTVEKDKFNDNLLFSCCCARVGPTWHPVCDCYCGGSKCDTDCLEKALMDDSLFYNVAINLYNNVTYLYPEANIWITGHSLGGALAGLLGATFGSHVVTFEAVAEKLPASRLHLPLPPSLNHITHVYHTADPIPMGTCTGVTSSCAMGGYALEARCHLGKVIVYDTITKLGWSSNVQNHGIKTVIDQVLSKDWEPDMPVPEAIEQEDCIDCYNWEFGDFKKLDEL